jgi:hypothetical protein
MNNKMKLSITLFLFSYLWKKAEALSDSEKKSLDEYNPSDNILQIHIVPHTHDDVGWLKTVEQYFYGRNSTIRHGCVSCILDSVIHALSENPSRKFTYVEMAFFHMWWNEQTKETKDKVRSLVKHGQLAFANGGWCMHDEATTHFMGMIDQTTLGHDFLKKEFDYLPSVGWQLDPFGHSATQASVMTSGMGFNALYLGRIDYQDLKYRYETRNCEGLWDASPSTNGESAIFWGLTGSFSGNYGAPEGFCFDILCTDDPLYGMKDESLNNRVIEFLQQVKIQTDRTKGSNVMLTMGSDFQYENALYNFKSLDLLIDTILSMDKNITASIFGDFHGINAFYSNPEMYTEFKYKEFVFDTHESEGHLDIHSIGKLETKIDDFFPYSDCDHCFWTGYFTSRPGLKRLERFGSAFLQAARQIQVLFCNPTDTQSCGQGALRALEEGVAVAQHHDGVSGTSKQHVAYDYMNKIQRGIDQSSTFISKFLKEALELNGIPSERVYFCQFLNETLCEASQDETQTTNSDFYLVLYNALGSQRSDMIPIPVNSDALYTVRQLLISEGQSLWNQIESAVLPNYNYGNVKGAAPFKLMVNVSFPPMSFSVLWVQSSLKIKPSFSISYKDDFIQSKGNKHIIFKNGALEQVEIQGSIFNISNVFGFYTSFEGSEPMFSDDRRSLHSFHPNPGSGAYIFRPSISTEKLHVLSPLSSKTQIIDTDLVTETHTVYEGGWVKQITRFYEDSDYIDVEYFVGPIPIEDSIGKEVIIRYLSDVQSSGAFFTDSNGREFLKRNRSSRITWNMTEYEPIAGNYYPVNTAAYLEDEQKSFSVITDRSQGGCSLQDGQLEFMIHRRILKDDARGVGEPLNETDAGIRDYPPFGDATRIGEGVIITGHHRLRFSHTKSGAKYAREEMDKLFSPIFEFVSIPHRKTIERSIAPYIDKTFESLIASQPPGVQLLTLSLRKFDPSSNTKTVLLRIGHAYAKGESDTISEIEVNLSEMFANFDISDLEEQTLSGNQSMKSWLVKKMHWFIHDTKNHVPLDHSRLRKPCHLDTTFVLRPMEIKTFEVSLRPKQIVFKAEATRNEY